MTGFNSKRQMAQAKLDDDDAQGYIAEYEAALLISYQSGFADGKQAQRKPLTDDEIWKNDNIMAANSGYGANFETLREVIRAIEAAHNIKEGT